MDSVRNQIASNIKRFRIANDMSVDYVGSAVGKSGKTISAWEVGRGQPDADAMIKLCRLFSVDISDFYGTESEKQIDKKEIELLDIFRTLTEDSKDAVMAVAKTLAKTAGITTKEEQ